MAEDFPGNFTWVDSIRNRPTSRDLASYVPFAGRHRHRFELTYKRAWYAARSFSQGMCNFHFAPFLYELIRRIVANDLEYRHLFAPVWLTGEIATFLCEKSCLPVFLLSLIWLNARQYVYFR